MKGVTYGTGRTIDVDSANLNLAKSWIMSCQESHSNLPDGCTPLRAPLDVPLKIIDCQDRHIRALRNDEPYVCLSYVWGSTVGSKAKNLTLPEQLPKTIEDAIWVASQLDIPRIWADQYCIDQENFQEKTSTIAAMDRIYGGADITIVAANGDASYGLSGVHGTPRRQQRFLHSQECTFLVAGDICQQIRSSRWNSRGWTYQEGMLASRRLVFTESQLYFQCDGMHCLETLDQGLNNQPLRDDRDLQFFAGAGRGYSLNTVYELLKEYFTRNLSFGSDSISAFEGVLNALMDNRSGSTRMKHLFGIPVFFEVG
ncbi:heterokaryon incompatibility protein-domain-containing protein, partial [Pyrenochaeta sp. MPI-SDFR-AT-0127]